MVSITPRKCPSGDVWRVQYRVDGRRIERTFRARADADAYAAGLPQMSTPGQVSNSGRQRPEPPLESHCKHIPATLVIEESEFMLSQGLRLAYVAEALRMSRTSLERACYRAGRADLIHRDRAMANTGGGL